MRHISWPDIRSAPDNVPRELEKDVHLAVEWSVLQVSPCLNVLAYKSGQKSLPHELLTQTQGDEVHKGPIAALHSE